MSRLADESSADAHPAFQNLPDCLTKCWDFETRQRPQMPSILRQIFQNRNMEETSEVEDIATGPLSPLSLDHATQASPEPLPNLHCSCPVAPVDFSAHQKAPLTPLLGRFESTSLPQLPRKLDSEGGGLGQDSVVLPGGIGASNFWSRIRVHVSNLPYQTGRQDLEVLFRSAGTVVSASVNRVNMRGRSTGTVVFESPEDAERAIRMFNGYSWSGQILEVRGDCGAESRLDMGSTRRNMGTASASRTDRSRPLPLPRGNINQLYVGNLPYQVTWQVLTELFRSAGSVLRAEINISPSGRVQGSGTVVFASARDAQIAIQMFDGYEWYGRRLEVRELQGADIHSTAPISAADAVSTSGGRDEDGRDFSSDICTSSISRQPTHIATPSRQM
ncbi:hypothetical protein FRC04_009541 [Tulasnella sp. 424]|nr:hypothetical protein FRC04_009541 [Tulasnella sp. 424]